MDLKILLLDSGARQFKDNFAITVYPSSGVVDNIYNDWNYRGQYNNIHDLSYPYLNNCFTGMSGSGQYCAQINRNKENYIINRPMNINYSFYHTHDGGNTQSCFSEFAIGGSTTALDYWTGDPYYVRGSILGGLSIYACSATANTNNATVYIASNGTNIATVGNYANNTKWYVFLQFRGNTLNYAINSTGETPTSYSSVDITGIILTNNYINFLIMSVNGATAGARPVIIDDCNILLL